jgi:hypothetical protein
MSHSRLIGPLSLSRTAIIESHIFRTPCRHCLSVVIIKPQLRLLRMFHGLVMYPNYQAPTASVALVTKVWCVVVALMVAHALTPDTLEILLAWIVVSCWSPWSHIIVQPSQTIVFGSIFYLIVLCGIIYLYISPNGHNNYIKLYSAWKSGKLNWNTIKHG